MTQRTSQGGLQVATVLNDLLTERICPGTGLEPAAVWDALEKIVADLAPKVRVLLARRDELQLKIDEWHRARTNQPHDAEAYKKLLTEIGYLLPEGNDFSATTANVDAEVATIAGPQLVVPVTNARYALNAANARWGSLYDALYGTDVIPEADGCEKSDAYNPRRGAKVIAFARDFIDQAAPLAGGSHKDATGYSVNGGKLSVTLANRQQTILADAAKFAGYVGQAAAPTAVLLVNNGLHIEIQFDRAHAIGKDPDAAGIKDVVLESARKAFRHVGEPSANHSGRRCEIRRLRWTSRRAHRGSARE
jgi:malate synthase